MILVKNRNKNLIDLNFEKNNYIYYKKNNEDNIKLINIQKQEYKDILINGGLTNEVNKDNSNNIVNNLLTEYPDSSYNIIKCTLLSIRNRFQLINKISETNIFAFESYITRGTLFYYKTILDAIKSKIKNKKNDSYLYLPILFSIFFYQTLFEKLYNKIIDDQVINFKLLDDYIFSSETTQKTNTLNSFASLFYIEIKPFLDQYKAADSEQKVKLFCNINDNYGVINKYKTTDNVKNNIRKLIGKNYKQTGNGDNNNTEVDKRVFTIKNEKSKSKYDILEINTNTNLETDSIPEKCEPFDLNFNKIFDGTNPQVMAPYMAASNVINNYEGLMLFTFGYSGVGKSFTVFGGGNIKGVLPSIINSIQNVDSVDVRIYEIYGMGLNINNDNFNENKYFKYISYQLDDQIGINKNLINITDNLENVESKNLDTNNLKKFLKKLNEDKGINDNIEEIRGKINDNIQYSEGKIKDDDINIKTIKKTKNNPDSSRSILCYELIINKDRQKIPFIICDLPGKEDIKNSFGEEGKGLLKINDNNIKNNNNNNNNIKNNNNNIKNNNIKNNNIKNEIINDKFLNHNFGNILEKLDKQLKPDKIKEIFKEIDNEINETIDNNNIKITYELLRNIQTFSGNFNSIFKQENFKKYDDNIELKKIKIITSDNNNNNEVRIKNLIANIPDLLTFNQKKIGNNFNDLTNSENRIFSKINDNNYLENSKLYIGFNKKYNDKIKITEENNNSNGINFEFIDNDNDNDIINNIKNKISNINVELKSQQSKQSQESQQQLLNNIDKGILEKYDNNIKFFISDANLIELEKIANQKLNKKRLIKAMNNAIYYVSTNKTKQTHPILKLTQILDEINDNEYINDYVNNAEKCFRYTKAAEGIFINENINGIIQLLSDKKGLSNSDNNNQNNIDYNDKKMYYNEKNTDNSFNKTIIYEKLYNIYEEKTSNASNNAGNPNKNNKLRKIDNNAGNPNKNNKLRKIDNMYAFFVVANISKNERIKQKLICNATKTSKYYKTEQELGWVCDQEEVDEKNKEKEEKEKKEKEDKIKEIKEIIERTLTNKNYFQLIVEPNNNQNYIILINLNKNLNKIDNINFNIIDDRKNKQKKSIATKLLNYMSEIIKDKIKEAQKKKELNDSALRTYLNNNLNKIKKIYIEELTNKLYDEYMIKNNTIEEEISTNNIQSDTNNFERKLYIREMCETQIALFSQLKDKINQINKLEE
jgi:hypothetical protein